MPYLFAEGARASFWRTAFPVFFEEEVPRVARVARVNKPMSIAGLVNSPSSKNVLWNFAKSRSNLVNQTAVLVTGGKMSRTAKPRDTDMFEQAYSEGYTCHGDIRLDPEEFAAYLIAIAEKHLGPGVPRTVALSFIDTLHTSDVYLAAACAQGSAEGWGRFMELYQKYLNAIALSVSPSGDAACELADSVLVEMFLPDRSGHSRIASYHGRSSLATWLRAIVCHRAINERERKDNSLERIESMPEMAEQGGASNIDAILRASRYQDLINDSLRNSCHRLTDRERLLLLLRYDDELQVSQIARLLGVCPSTVTRQLERVQEKLRENVVSTLTSKHNLQPAAIEECLADLRDNPSYSILTLVKVCSGEATDVASPKTLFQQR